MTSTGRRHDPERRQRIIRAALEIVAEHGVAGTTHRRVAAEAGVPLGSMTYHFKGLDDLLIEAFKRLADTNAARFVEHLRAAADQEQAREAVVNLIVGDGQASPRDMLLSYELYAYAARKPALQEVMQTWMARSREALEQHFPAQTARELDAMIEGLSIHQSVDHRPMERDEIRSIVDRIVG